MFAARVLGIDPGLTRCGYAVVDGRGANRATAVAIGVIRTPPQDALPQRLAALRQELADLIAEHQPDAVAVEHVFFQVNVRTAMSVGQASGLALAEAAAAGCDVAQYTPNQVKDAVAGWGAAAEGAGAADGAGPPAPGHPTPTGRRRRCLRAGPLPPGDGPDAGPTRRGDDVIGSLRGEVLERGLDGTVLVEAGGVGYLVSVTPRTLAELEPTATVFLHIHHHIRESDQTLYGFASRDERETFQTLIGTHGVGPAVAMAILATHPPRALFDIVAAADVGALTLVPGIGKKTAERLLVELKSRLSVPMLDPVGSGGGSAVGDVREALNGLGYGPDEVRDVLRELPSDRDAATLLRDALKLLGARRAG